MTFATEHTFSLTHKKTTPPGERTHKPTDQGVITPGHYNYLRQLT